MPFQQTLYGGIVYQRLIKLSVVGEVLVITWLYRVYYMEIHCSLTSSRDSQNPESVIYELCFSSLFPN